MDTLAHAPAKSHGTHTVFNQPPPLVDYNLFTQDVALLEGVRRAGGGWAEPQLSELGARAGSAEVIQWGFDANQYLPVLHTHDRYGYRIDEVTY
ncbi:MAG: DNA alkylation response protein, partial [Ktedonobacteraceae bacterium]|nr:DNA alkylation response protein [Ktedonobacteraceae bacterium]